MLRRKLVPWGRVRVCAKSVYPDLDTSAAFADGYDCRFAQDEDDFNEATIEGDDDISTHKVAAMILPKDESTAVEQAELLCLGIPREPEDFVARAVKAGHPQAEAACASASRPAESQEAQE